MNTVKIFNVAALVALFNAVPSIAAVTVGNPVVAAPVVDACTVCTFVINDGFNLAGLAVKTYTFQANTTNQITPFLASRLDSGNTATFTVTAIGQQRTATLGLNTFSFNSLAGLNVTSANSYFGFAYNNGGVVAFDYASPSAATGTFVGPTGYFPTLGGTFNSQFGSQPANSFDALNARTYSISAVAAVPEPATWAMMMGGFGIVGGAMRYRRRETKIDYATA